MQPEPLAAGIGAPWAIVVGLIGFLTLVDLFAAQAILPSLVEAYGVAPSAMGLAVNAGTLGMAVASLAVALFGARIDRRKGITASLALLALPTSLLAVAPDLATFAALRIVQGLLMATAFTLTATWLAEHHDALTTQSALAAYVTGIVASNLVGRMISAAVADQLGLAPSFYLFAALNLAGAVLVAGSFACARMTSAAAMMRPPAAWRAHLANPPLRAAFCIGFLILFAFIGTFTYVNFVLAGPPLGLSSMSLGLVYLVFLPSMVTTPLAGGLARRFGARWAARAGLLLAVAGLPLLLLPSLAAVLAGMALVGVGTFLAQAVATGFVGRGALSERAAASGLYLASYYLGGLAGAAFLGQVFDRLGWPVTVAAIGSALVLAGHLSGRLDSLPAPNARG
jgi:predicted MFS family arabinose efflux permease